MFGLHWSFHNGPTLFTVTLYTHANLHKPIHRSTQYHIRKSQRSLNEMNTLPCKLDISIQPRHLAGYLAHYIASEIHVDTYHSIALHHPHGTPNNRNHSLIYPETERLKRIKKQY